MNNYRQTVFQNSINRNETYGSFVPATDLNNSADEQELISSLGFLAIGFFTTNIFPRNSPVRVHGLPGNLT